MKRLCVMMFEDLRKEQEQLMVDCGAFFAFSTKQFEDAVAKVDNKEKDTFSSLSGGLFVLTKRVDKFIDAMEDLDKRNIERDISENGLEKIIMRELGNHETQITGRLSDTLEALEGYKGVDMALIKKIYSEKYMPLCIKNDWF